MDEVSHNRVTKNLMFFKKNITQIGLVMDKLIEQDKISMNEKSDIQSIRSLDDQCHSLLELLIKRGCFDELIEALKVSGNDHIAKKLLEIDGETSLGMFNTSCSINKAN